MAVRWYRIFSAAYERVPECVKITQFQPLSSQQKRWLWSAYWRLWGVWWRIKLRQGAWLNSKLDLSDTVSRPVSPDAVQIAMKMHESVRLAARLHWLNLACLPKSIVLSDMLQELGVPASVKLGVNKRDHQLASHAWVQVNDTLIGEPQHMKDQFTEIRNR